MQLRKIMSNALASLIVISTIASTASGAATAAEPEVNSNFEIRDARSASEAVYATEDRVSISEMSPGSWVTVQGTETGFRVSAPIFPGTDSTYSGLSANSVISFRDGSKQIIFEIPEDHKFESPFFKVVSLGDQAFELLPAEGGGLVVSGLADGTALGYIAPAWAITKSGVQVPSHFRIVEGGFRQVIETAGLTSADFPIFADPYMGTDLFEVAKVVSDTYAYPGSWKVVLKKSTFGQFMHNYLTGGIPIFLNEGWLEAKAKVPSIASKPSLHDQYDCHVAGGFLDFAGETWDLEYGRPNRTQPWWQGVVQHRCNWTTAGGL